MERRLKLNLGCGMVRPAGWVNTDSSLNSLLQALPLGKRVARRFSRVEYVENNASFMNLNRRWRGVASGTVDVVYASHLLEHLTRATAQRFLSEAYRSLRPGGVIRIVVPDLYALSRRYVDAVDRGESGAADEFLYCLNLHQDGQYPPERPRVLRLVSYLQKYPSQHKYMYDRFTLPELMRSSGFVGLREGRYAESHYLAAEISEVENTAEGVPSIYWDGLKPDGTTG
jgi:predicted SAM-dependent methyltransferase